MKLRMGSSGRHSMQRVFNGRLVSGGYLGIRTAVDEEMGYTDLELYGCTRPLMGFKAYLGSHCFLMLKDSEGTILDSASFGQSGGGNRDAVEQGSCTKIGAIDIGQWLQIKEDFRNCGTYNVVTNNCCTCATNTLVRMGQTVPQALRDLNYGVGVAKVY